MAGQHIALTIPSHPRFLQLVRGVVQKVAQIQNLSLDQTDNITLAVDEACSNIIRHAYMNDTSRTLDLDFNILENRLDITITDYGKQCDAAKLVPKEPDQTKPGGLGLYIMHTVMDDVTFECTLKGKNIVRMSIDLKETDTSLSP
ncbi:MAG: ATP-binding protein [Desulfobacterales bacterium]|nr:ATP-binding protein [Desulfobacterales bacterium]